jgi:hypothetical protein
MNRNYWLSRTVVKLFLGTVTMLWMGCGVYSFTGASIDPGVKSFTVHTISNQASIIVPSLSQTLTQALRDRFITNTSLKQVENGGDLEFTGIITNYLVSPVAPVANQIAALNRLTVTVTIEFVNHQNEKQSWSTAFSRYSDYDSSKDLTSIQDQLIKDITQQLVDDIFNKSVVNW